MTRTLATVLAAAAGGLNRPIEQRVDDEGQIEYLRGGLPFAAVDPAGGWASFQLTTTVAAAAMRTPETESSARGPRWVTLRPAELDGHAADRAAAWFESAWRAAGN